MDGVKYLLKFGEKQHLDSFANGNLYFSNAETFQNIENKQQNKGQGDILEAGSRIFARNVVIESPNSNIALYIDCDINFLCYYKSVKKLQYSVCSLYLKMTVVSTITVKIS